MAAENSHPLVTSSNLLLDAKDENFQLIHRVIEEIIEEKRNATTGVEEDRLLLSGLLSQLESLKEESDGQPVPLADPNEIISKVNAEVSGQESSKHQEKTDRTSTEEVMRELREVKRQNRITHWLLSVMIVITAVWQLSEVTLILSVKNKVSNPFKTVGSMVTGFFKGKSTQTDEGNSSASPSCPHVEVPQLSSLHIPVLPQLD